MKNKLKLVVWVNPFNMYFEGMGVALAENEEQARELLNRKFVDTWKNDPGDVYKRVPDYVFNVNTPAAYFVQGGD